LVYRDLAEKKIVALIGAQKIQNGFLCFLSIFLGLTLLLNRNKHNW